MTDPIRRHTIADTLRRTAARLPRKPALVCGEVRWTYADFDAVVGRVAAGLAARGVTAGERIGVLSRNSHSFAAIRYALARLGAVLTPINFMLTAKDVAHILRHAGVTRLCVDSEFAPLGDAAKRDAPAVAETIWLPGETATAQPPGSISFADLAACDLPPPEPGFGPETIAQIMYTSGTESLPKGVMLTHEAILAQYATCLVDLEITEDDRILHALPMYHCAQLDVFLGPAVQAGAYGHIVPAPAADRVLRLLETEQLSSFFSPPTVWISLLRAQRFDGARLAHLTKGYYGASIMPVEILRELQARLPNLRLWNCYGQTEMAPLATVLKPRDQLRKAGSAGKPCINVETRVVREDGSDVDVGEIGEIVHRSPHLMLGYLDEPEKTAQAFAGGWFHSGDLAVLDEEGYLRVVDRRKDMIKTGGENVSSREVEEAIYELAGVYEAAVVGLPDPLWVEAVTAFVVPGPNARLCEADVMRHCASLAGFKRPKRVVLLDALPKNASGKVLKTELRRSFAES